MFEGSKIPVPVIGGDASCELLISGGCGVVCGVVAGCCGVCCCGCCGLLVATALGLPALSAIFYLASHESRFNLLRYPMTTFPVSIPFNHSSSRKLTEDRHTISTPSSWTIYDCPVSLLAFAVSLMHLKSTIRNLSYLR